MNFPIRFRPPLALSYALPLVLAACSGAPQPTAVHRDIAAAATYSSCRTFSGSPFSADEPWTTDLINLQANIAASSPSRRADIAEAFQDFLQRNTDVTIRRCSGGPWSVSRPGFNRAGDVAVLYVQRRAPLADLVQYVVLELVGGTWRPLGSPYVLTLS